MDLAPHYMYEVQYVQQSGNGRWYEWTMRAVYLGRDEQGNEQFSFSPKAGTGWVPAGNIVNAYMVDRSKSQVMLPKRQKGAVARPQGAR